MSWSLRSTRKTFSVPYTVLTPIGAVGPCAGLSLAIERTWWAAVNS